ncbi:MAG: outer membrane beta-barrel protein [Bacteroidota bacterium]
MKIEKKQSIIVSLCVMLIMTMTTNVYAQKGFNISVKAAPVLCSVFNKDDLDNDNYEWKPTVGASFGAGIGYGFTKNTGVAVDVLYALQGQRYEINNKEFNQHLNYIKVPLMFTYNIQLINILSLTGKAGPQVSFLSKSQLFDDDRNSIKNNTNDQFRNVTFGGMFSTGVNIKIGNNLFATGDMRFDGDFTNAEDRKYAFYPTDRKKSYNITAGLEFGLKYMLK